MYKSKLIQLYQTFDSQQLEQARKWVNSPIHNRHKDVTKLFEYLFSKQTITPRTTDRKKVFAYIYPKRQFDDLRFRHLMSLGVTLLEAFVSFSIQKKASISQEKALIQYCVEHNLDKLAQQYIQKSKKEQEKKAHRTKDYYQNQYELTKEILVQDQPNANLQHNLEELFTNQSIDFVLKTLEQVQLALTRQPDFLDFFEVPFLENILADINVGKFQGILLIEMYYLQYLLLTNPEDEAYLSDLKELLFTKKQALAPSEVQGLYHFILNYYQQHQYRATTAIFNFYKYGLAEKILLNNKVIPPTIYLNTLHAALNAKKHVAAAEFLSKYTPLLAPNYQTAYNHYARAMLLFSKGVYKSALLLFKSAQFEDIPLQLATQIAILKIYYLNRDKEAFEDVYSGLQTMIKEQDLPLSTQKSALHNAQIIQQLMTIETISEKQALIAIVKTTQPLSERVWLLEQLST